MLATLYDRLAQSILLPAWDWRNGDNVLQYRSEVCSLLDARLERVRKFQLQRIGEICEHAHKNTDFYRRRFDECGLGKSSIASWEDFRRIPVLTKSELRDQLTSLTSKAYACSELRKSATGGTTQSPITFFIDRGANDRRWAATHEWDRRIGYSRGERLACLWGASQDLDSNPSWKQRVVSRFITRTLQLPSSPLDDERMANYYTALKKWRPRLLFAYPTPLAVFAEFLLKEKLTLNIPSILVTAEPLLDSQTEIIFRAFRTLPYNSYCAREAGRIATECNHHQGMHVNAYGLFVEIDASDNYSDATMGRVLITDLWNVGMPIIRYAIGDVGTMTTEPCACGSELPRIVAVVGRTTDLFVNSVGQRIPGVAFTNRIIRDNQEVREMQFVQTAVGEFKVLVVPGTRWQGEASKDAIIKKLCEFMQEPTQVSISLVASIPREASGKARFCKSLLNAS